VATELLWLLRQARATDALVLFEGTSESTWLVMLAEGPDQA